MGKDSRLIQPKMRKLFLADEIYLTRKAEQVVLELHLFLGGKLTEGGECSAFLNVERGKIDGWKSYEDAITYNGVASQEEYHRVWEEIFPCEKKIYTFITEFTMDGGASLKISDGESEVLLSRKGGEYMIPQVFDILENALCIFREVKQ
jgi:hypothetical protein